MNSELIGLAIGLLLTLFIFSYLLGDNWIYRIAIHIMVGVSAAYAAVIAVEEVLLPVFDRLLTDPAAPAALLWLFPLLLGLLLLLTWYRPATGLGSVSVSLLVATGAAVALVGVISGTLIPQIVNTPGGAVWEQLLIAIFTVATLLYFQFTGRADAGEDERSPVFRGVAGLGRGMLMVTFGALFAGAFTTSLFLLTDRLSYVVGGLIEFANVFLP